MSKHALECIEQIMVNHIEPELAKWEPRDNMREVIEAALYVAFCDGAIAAQARAKAEA